MIRTIIVERGNRAAENLHKQKSMIVKATTQALMAEALADDLTEEEMSYYKRGRNAKSYSSAKNASITDYRKATGYEALMGYLYLTNQEERMIALTKLGMDKIGIEV